MIGSKPPEAVATVLAQLTRQPYKLLEPSEVFVAACQAYPAGEPHLQPLSSRRRRQPVAVTSSEDRLHCEAAARFRFRSAQSALGLHNDQFGDLPRSDNGYLLADSDRQMPIFSGTGKRCQLQSPMKGLWLQPIDHGDDMHTLVFGNREDRLAFVTRRESVEMTRNFIDSFPDQCQQTRVLSVTNDQNIIEFENSRV